VKLRYQIGPEAERLAPTAEKYGFLHALVERFATTLHMSSITNLVDLIEDEVIPDAMPLVLDVRNSLITIKNDAPPTHPTSPGVIPLDVQIDDIVVWRGPDNVFNVSTGGKAPFGMGAPPRAISEYKPSHDSSGPSDDATQEAGPQFPQGFDESLKAKVYSILDDNEILKKRLHVAETEKMLLDQQLCGDSGKSVKDLEFENDQLRRQLEKIAKLDGASANENLTREIGQLRDQANLSESVQRENTELIQHLAEEQDEVVMLKEERESLLGMIQMLQDELSTAEHMRSNRVSSIS
jgi:hypothetical protein